MSPVSKCLRLLFTAIVGASPAAAGTIYWTDFARDSTGGISRANLDVLQVESVIPTGLLAPYRIAIDDLGGKMYWTSTYCGEIRRANLDGSGLETIVEFGSGPNLGITVDGDGGKLYWSLWSSVCWANLDGSDAEFLFDAGPPGVVQDLALDLVNRKIYASNWDGSSGPTGRIQRANLDGSGLEDAVTEISNGPVGLGVDADGEKVYWANFDFGSSLGAVQRANLDGANRETIVPDVDTDSLALDLEAGKVYWTEPDFNTDTGTIRGANLDGSEVETLPFSEIFPAGIAITAIDIGIPCPGDLNGDGEIDIVDLAHVLMNYGTTSGASYADGDIDLDGDVDLADLAALLAVYGTSCP